MESRPPNWGEKLFGTFTICAIVGFCLFLSPGLIFDWTFGRFANTRDGLVANAIKDGATWLISFLFWIGVAALAAMFYRRYAKLHAPAADDLSAAAGGTANRYGQWQQPVPEAGAEYVHEQAEPPPEEDDLSVLCTDQACAEALGLSGDLTMEDIRSAYRQRIAAYHPDKVAHLGPKLREVAEVESKRLNIAYQYFEEHYGQAA